MRGDIEVGIGKLAMCFSSKLVAGIAATMIVCDPALAYHAEPYASAQINGTQEKTVIHTKAPGHYIVCVEWGKYSLQLIYDTDSTDMEPGDCISVEASKISINIDVGSWYASPRDLYFALLTVNDATSPIGAERLAIANTLSLARGP